MSVSVSIAGPVTTARLRGEIDTYSVGDVREAFERLPIVADGRVVVDLREVEAELGADVAAEVSRLTRAILARNKPDHRVRAVTRKPDGEATTGRVAHQHHALRRLDGQLLEEVDEPGKGVLPGVGRRARGCAVR